MTSVLQAASGVGSVREAIGLLVVGVVVTAVFATHDRRARYDAVHTRAQLWLVAILLFPLVGGIGYVLWEY